jgi:hypothetical protein
LLCVSKKKIATYVFSPKNFRIRLKNLKEVQTATHGIP